MKTLIILTATEDKLDYIPSVRASVVLYLGEMNLENDNEDDTPANAICFNGQLTKEQKEYLTNRIFKEYDNEISIIFFEQEGEPDIPDDYTLIIKSK
jgi:hypothetical protein